jgi:hypothetical protein
MHAHGDAAEEARLTGARRRATMMDRMQADFEVRQLHAR